MKAKNKIFNLQDSDNEKVENNSQDSINDRVVINLGDSIN